MENENSVIYGLEFQARALTPQQAETEKIRFFIGTQSLKQTNNQIHLVEFDEENSTLKTTVFYHTLGEIWKINSSPINTSLINTCYNTITNDNTCSIRTSILKVPQDVNSDQIENLDVVVNFSTELLESDVKTNEFNPLDETKSITVCENQVTLWDISESEAKSILNINLEGKNNPKFTTGKWNPHQNCNQFTTATETHLKTYDIRSGQIAWHIESVHSQLLRDLDYNLNKQYHLATCGDDGFVKIWDFRQTTQPVYSRSDHSHWVWCVRFNPFHDQLLLTASSDARVLISSAASVSSESNTENILSEDSTVTPEPKQMLSDGPLQWCEHEDSVYCAEWSPAEPWIFASLSYDGRLLISRVKRSLKYQIML
ncbi:wd-repeat protein [Holotrichia oblita]|uniref:Wd-repeat protein n=2 Tax=Holotrichia oblita TaxID=644536 RepID=A0ACB9THY7_HOLOL|nr:wd-repeat protein [Holotrichia oblita]KAI4466522.1 wd-repeat protein [Holotrichia oblita]